MGGSIFIGVWLKWILIKLGYLFLLELNMRCMIKMSENDIMIIEDHEFLDYLFKQIIIFYLLFIFDLIVIIIYKNTTFELTHNPISWIILHPYFPLPLFLALFLSILVAYILTFIYLVVLILKKEGI
jgi:hypothetical protein